MPGAYPGQVILGAIRNTRDLIREYNPPPGLRTRQASLNIIGLSGVHCRFLRPPGIEHLINKR